MDHSSFTDMKHPCVSTVMCVCCRFSRVWLFATPWTVAHKALLPTRFSREEHWSGSPRPPPGDLPDPGIKPTSQKSLALARRFFSTSASWEVIKCYTRGVNRTLGKYVLILCFDPWTFRANIYLLHWLVGVFRQGWQLVREIFQYWLQTPYQTQWLEKMILISTRIYL